MVQKTLDEQQILQNVPPFFEVALRTGSHVDLAPPGPEAMRFLRRMAWLQEILKPAGMYETL